MNAMDRMASFVGEKMRRLVPILMICLFLPFARAQSAPDFPSKVLLIRRESLKPGTRTEHERSEAARTRALQRKRPWLALNSISGPDEVWFAGGYETFAAMEQDRQSQRALESSAAVGQRYRAQESQFVSSIRSLTCVLAPEMSYRPQIDMAGIRYFRIRVTHVKPGHDGEYRELRKIINTDEYEKPARDVHVPVYHVTSGAPTGTYITLFPVKSPAEWDQPSPAMRQFLGADFEKVTDLMEKTIVSYEDALFEVSPAMSLPIEEWVKADPAFWAGERHGSDGTASERVPRAQPHGRKR